MLHKRAKSNTCIGLIKTKSGKLIIAGDRRLSWGWSLAQSMPRPKIAKRQGLLLGATGDGTLCSLFVNCMEIPKIGNKDLTSYMNNEFYNAIYNELVQHGYAEEHNLLKIPEDSYCELVVGIKKTVWSIVIANTDNNKDSAQGLIMIDEVNHPYATGCGGMAALGVLVHEQIKNKHLTEKHLLEALQTAAKLSPGCDSEIDILRE